MKKSTITIYVYYCSNSIDANALSSRISEKQTDEFRLVGLPCSGKIDIPYLIKAFETGADGVVLVTCPDGECRSLEGNLRARKRSEAVESLLEEIGIEQGRMTVVMVKDNQVEQTIHEIDDFIEKVRNLPRLLNNTTHV
jgi:coenzyme F420-reducing hydrogenase delta subunit